MPEHILNLPEEIDRHVQSAREAVAAGNALWEEDAIVHLSDALALAKQEIERLRTQCPATGDGEPNYASWVTGTFPFYTRAQVDAAVREAELKYNWLIRNMDNVERPRGGGQWLFTAPNCDIRTYPNLDALVSTEMLRERP